MNRKSFVAIYILPDSLYIVELSSNRKTLLQSIKVDLPQGLIKNYQITNIETFSKAILMIWEKYNIKERAVGIVVPEFSAFTKLLSLPKLAFTELNEAVIWAAQEYIPHDSENMLLDWKIVQQKDDQTEVFVVAIKKEVILGYAQAIENAGLYPLLVEIPSISLVRLGGQFIDGTLFVFGSKKESIIVIGHQGTIVGSSVVHGNNTADLISTCKKITTHFHNIEVSSIFIGGELEETSAELSKIYKKNAVELAIPLKNITEEIAREYLIPLSLAKTDITQPADPFTINLLPQKYVNKYKSAKSRRQSWSLLLSITFFVWVSLFSALTAFLYLSQSIKTFTTTKNATSDVSVKRTEAAALVKSMHTMSDKVVAIKKISVIPQEILNMIEASRPSNVTITSYKLDFDLGEIRVGGYAANRISLIQFKQDLEKNETIGVVNIPISNFESETNLEYQLSFDYLPITKDVTIK